jgi:hypothetical protein
VVSFSWNAIYHYFLFDLQGHLLHEALPISLTPTLELMTVTIDTTGFPIACLKLLAKIYLIVEFGELLAIVPLD